MDLDVNLEEITKIPKYRSIPSTDVKYAFAFGLQILDVKLRALSYTHILNHLVPT